MSNDLSIIIVTYNSADVIDDLLESIPNAVGTLRAQVVVVDNGSTDDTVEHVSRHADVTLVEAPNNGYAAGLNLGVQRAASSPLFLLLNPDTRLGPNSIPPLVEAVRMPGIGIVAPLVRNASGDIEHSLRREPTLLRAIGLSATRIPLFSEYLNRDDDYRAPRIVDWALGAALLFTKDCYVAMGGWDESYFLYSEETDFCLRAKELGFATRFEPRSEIVHIGGASGRNDTTHVMQIINRVRLYARRHRRPLGYLYLAMTVLSELSWIARGHPQSRASVRALLVPKQRPAALGLRRSLLPV